MVSRKGDSENVGLLPFARVALEGGRSLVPPYRNQFKHQFARLQLLTVLCLMRYEE